MDTLSAFRARKFEYVLRFIRGLEMTAHMLRMSCSIASCRLPFESIYTDWALEAGGMWKHERPAQALSPLYYFTGAVVKGIYCEAPSPM